MTLATVTVAGTITAPDGTPFARKTVWFTTMAEMVDAAGNVLYPITRIQARVITGELKAADGTSPLELVDSDAGLGTVPYVIEESWANGRKFTVNLTASMIVSGHIPYSTLGPVTPAPTAVGPFALLSDVETRDTATLAAAESYTDAHSSSGAVSSVYGRTGAVTAQTGDYTKTQVGLGNVDNTSDANKPVSTAQQTALNGKADLSGPGATVPRNQLPNISGSFWQQVANQAAMLALTAPDADTALVVFRTDTPGTVWFLNPGLNPATLGNWGSYQDDAAGAAAAAQTAAQTFATSAVATQHTTDTGLYPTVVNHGATAGTARPSGAGMVLWVGSVAPTNGVAGDQWRDTTLIATRWLVGTAWFYPPGLELGYQERVSNDTTTNTARSSAASNTISGLTVSGVVGTGQPVDIEYYCPAVVHSVAATFVGADFVVNGVGNAEQQAVVDSPVTASGRTLILRRRKILTAGTSYSFDIGKYLGAAGTGTYVGASNQPMHLSVTCR